MDYPESSDPVVTALQSLLKANGGHVKVAEKAHVNDQSLYQIATLKTDSKTKKPKSVGPSIRRRLDKAYPGWMTADALPMAQEPPGLSEAVNMVLDALGAVPKIRWPAIEATLEQAVGHPEMRDDLAPELLAMLQPMPPKQLSA
jgi:hypothetical protein